MTTRSFSRLDGLGLLCLLSVAAVIRIYAWQQTHVLFNDGPIFLAMAEAIADGRWSDVLAHSFHPLYPAVVALAHALLPLGLEASAVAVSILGGLLSVAALFVMVRRAFDSGLAWLAALTLAAHPWAVDFSSDVMSDGLYLGFYLVGFAALIDWIERPRLGSAAICGLGAGLAYLVRPEGVGLAIIALLLVGLRTALEKEGRPRAILSGLVLGVACAGTMAPLLGALSAEQGELTLTRKKSVSALAAGQAAPEAAREVGRATETVVEARPRGVVAATAAAARPVPLPLPRSSEYLDGPSEVRPPRTAAGALDAMSRALRTSLAAFRYELGAFAVLGLWALRGRMRRMREAAFFLPAVAYSVVLILLVWGAGYVARRHALAGLLPLTAYAALGWRSLVETIMLRWGYSEPERFVPGRAATAIFVALALVLAVAWGPRNLRDRREDRAAVRAAAEWLAENGGTGDRVGAQKLRIAYYAKGLFVPLPSGTGVPIKESLEARGVEWLVIDEVRLDEHRGLSTGLGNWLQIVHVEARAGRRALVLELR